MQLKEALGVLEEIAFYLELKGENVFKVNAFYNAVRNLSKYDISLKEAFEKNIIQNTKGVGKSIQSVLEELLNKGESSLLNELKKDFPESILTLTQIRGLGAKKIKKLYEELNVTSIDELEQACIENKLMRISGFGEKTQISILENIKKLKDYHGKLLLHHAEVIAQSIIEEAKKFKLKNIVVTGELRLRSKIISTIDFLIEEDKFIDNFLDHFKAKNLDDNIFETYLNGYHLRFFVEKPEFFVFELFRTTGTREFLDRIQFQKLTFKNFNSEHEIFEKLELPFIPPQARENEQLEIKKYDFPDISDLKGLIHIHSNYSDGSNTLEEILTFAENNGYQYVLVSDHSKSAFYANGLNELRLLEQWKEIDELNAKSNKVKIFKGIECDILPDGSLDFDDEILSQFDCVIASVHSRFKMSKVEMTNRIIKALRNKYVKILGHPTGRLLLSRDPYHIDIDEIINITAQEGKSIELNCNPYRLDLDWEFHQKAKSKGIKITISPDAHSFEDMTYVKLGIDMAIKGGLEKKDILNCLDIKVFETEFCKT